ncbi:Integrase core domain-containing protein [Brevibacterium sp. Mu109]|uniref:IS21 family transposase n=1 Tax=Brevibacterium sp. Mu109 TaxID=1255669 RepID=UPI000C3E334D|nr:IS21 family transposase [Brevibacterium sp. Mu109]SMY01409.1 Integrase core domain-containing protein [Brevibacterium sp. Mu109]
MKDAVETMKILSAYDLTKSLRGAAELAGCSHHTVDRLVRARDAGQVPGAGPERAKVTDAFLPKIEEWVESSGGRVRADVVHDKLTAMGYTASQRSTRRAVAEVKAAWRAGKRRVHRPWITEPGVWLQYDFGDGPVIDGAKRILFVAWLAWSRFRIVVPLRDRTAPSVFAALDRCFRIIGGAPTYVLTDNEKTVTVSHVAGVPVRNQATLAFARHYSVEVLTCRPADPAAKGGVENAVKLAKADLVPKDTNLLPEYASFAELEAACTAFMAMVNAREHRTTRRRPDHMLAEETSALHRIPEAAHTVAYGTSRKVPENTPMVSFENAQYSVPAHLLGAEVFVRHHGTGPDSMVVIMHPGPDGPVEVARHKVARPGSPAIDDAHFPGHDPGKVPGDYTPVPRSVAEAEFLAIGAGAKTWLAEAAAAGTSRIHQKMAEAVTLAKLAGTGQVDRALGVAAVHQRFAHGDLASLLAAAGHRTGVHTATEERSLTQGTAGWAGLGTTNGGPAAEPTTAQEETR